MFSFARVDINQGRFRENYLESALISSEATLNQFSSQISSVLKKDDLEKIKADQYTGVLHVL